VPGPQLPVVVDRRAGEAHRGVEADRPAPGLRGRRVRRGGRGDLRQGRGERQHAGPADPEGDGLDAGLAEAGVRAVQGGADPRTVDLSLDPSERPYGSLFGKRPDLINYGLTGFGRLTTPEAWLSTWSGLSSNADFLRCAPGVTVPTLFIELTGDQAAFPADSRRMTSALGATDLTTATVRDLHFGGPVAKSEAAGNELAAAEIIAWLAKRHELTPPA
jgi:hypothetical protein